MLKTPRFRYCVPYLFVVPLQPKSRTIKNENDDSDSHRDHPRSYDLSGKTIALFGCGDCSSYSGTFVGGMGELYNGIKNSGAKFIGSVETDDYTFDDSEAVIDGKFVGLPLDDINEDDKTDTRIEAWIAAITPCL